MNIAALMNVPLFLPDAETAGSPSALQDAIRVGADARA
jgi:hypothetical protein